MNRRDIDPSSFPNVGNNPFYNKEFSVGQMLPQSNLSDNTIIRASIQPYVDGLNLSEYDLSKVHNYMEKEENAEGLVFLSFASDWDENVIQPRIPDNYLTRNGYEDNTTPRVCFSTSVKKALRALSQRCEGMELYVYTPGGKYNVITPTKEQVPDVMITDEKWICTPVTLYRVGKIKITGHGRGPGLPYRYGDKIAKLYDWAWKWIEKDGQDPCDGHVLQVMDSVEDAPNIPVIAESSAKSDLEEDHKQKGKRNLNEFKRVRLTDNLRKKYTPEYKFLKHFYGADETHDTYAWFDKDKIVGAICVSQPDKKYDGQIWLSDFYITEEYRQYGLGDQMLKFAYTNCHADALGVAHDNMVARRLYEKHGFKYGKDVGKQHKAGNTNLLMYKEGVNLVPTKDKKTYSTDVGNGKKLTYDSDDWNEVVKVFTTKKIPDKQLGQGTSIYRITNKVEGLTEKRKYCTLTQQDAMIYSDPKYGIVRNKKEAKLLVMGLTENIKVAGTDAVLAAITKVYGKEEFTINDWKKFSFVSGNEKVFSELVSKGYGAVIDPIDTSITKSSFILINPKKSARVIECESINESVAEPPPTKNGFMMAHHVGEAEVWNSLLVKNGKRYREKVEILILQGDSVLLRMVPNNPSDTNPYKIPGGSTEPKETLTTSAIRECQEEVRITPKNLKYYGYRTQLYKSGVDYDGYLAHIFVAQFDKRYTGYVAPEDVDEKMLNESRFYKLGSVRLLPEHQSAINQYFQEMGITLKESAEDSNKAPKVTAKVKSRDNQNDSVSKKGVKVDFYNDKGEHIGEASVSAVDTDSPYAYDIEVFSKFRGQHYGHSIMNYLMKHYKVAELGVKTDNEKAINLYKKHGFNIDKKYKWDNEDLYAMRSKYYNPTKKESVEEVVTENWIMSEDNFEINLDDWAPGNPLWITGASGDGKSTLAAQLAKEHNAEVVTSDIVLVRLGHSKENFLMKLQKAVNSHGVNLTNSPALDYVNSHPNLPYNCFNRETKSWDNARLLPHMIGFYMWFMKEAATNPKYKNRLFIVEGCDICQMPPEIMINKPLIICGGSRLRGLWRRAKREVGEKNTGMLKALFKYIDRYKYTAVELDDNKEFFRNSIMSLSESTDMKRSELPDDVFGIPQERKYPMPDEKHTRSAMKLFNHCEKKYEEQLAKHIIKNIKKYNIDPSFIGPKNRLRKYLVKAKLLVEGVIDVQDTNCIIDKMMYEFFGDKPQMSDTDALFEKFFGEASMKEDIKIVPDRIEPMVKKLENKHYRVKYASPGHANTRFKEDRNKDGVIDGKLVSTGRIIFEKDYHFDSTPDGWEWKKLSNGFRALYVKPFTYSGADGHEREAFRKWQNDYMNNLREWVDNLPMQETDEPNYINKPKPDDKGNDE